MLYFINILNIHIIITYFTIKQLFWYNLKNVYYYVSASNERSKHKFG